MAEKVETTETKTLEIDKDISLPLSIVLEIKDKEKMFIGLGSAATKKDPKEYPSIVLGFLKGKKKKQKPAIYIIFKSKEAVEILKKKLTEVERFFDEKDPSTELPPERRAGGAS